MAEMPPLIYGPFVDECFQVSVIVVVSRPSLTGRFVFALSAFLFDGTPVVGFGSAWKALIAIGTGSDECFSMALRSGGFPKPWLPWNIREQWAGGTRREGKIPGLAGTSLKMGEGESHEREGRLWY
jgi:hypothetical protein